MNFQDASNLRIPEGYVRTIHDKDSRLLWGSVGYDVSFDGNAEQTTYSGKNLFSGNFSQFDNQGGTGSTYRYFKLPTDGAYTLTLKAKNNATSEGALSIGFNNTGGALPQQYRWVAQISSASAGQTFSHDNTSLVNGTTKCGYVCLYPATSAAFDWFNNNFEIQLEAGSTATSYEPYVGGTASPNPDYPQPISTVTGAQTAVVTGKNLLNPDTFVSNYYISATGVPTRDGFSHYSAIIPVVDGRTYVLSGIGASSGSGNKRVHGYDSNGNWVQQLGVVNHIGANVPYSVTVTIPNGITGVRVSTLKLDTQIQFELGSTATAYEPYQSYSYSLSLGSIELCKIGDYQDYIYKSGDDWYVHKAINKVILDGSEAWSMYPGRDGTFYITKSDIMLAPSISATPDVISDYYEPKPFISLYNMIVDYGVANHNAQRWIAIRNKDYSDVSSFKTWLASNNTTVYYVLATPTDTQITDGTLIAQLEAVYNWVRRYGYNAQVSGNLPIIINRTALPNV